MSIATGQSSDSRTAAVWYAPEDVRVEAVPSETLGDDEVRVRVSAVGVCGSDVHFFYRGLDTGQSVPPFVMGHEASGVVIASGSPRYAHLVGSRVAIEPGVPCGRCEDCRAGTYNLCPKVKFFADPPVNGALATELVVHAEFVYVVPEELSDDAAALIEPTSCAIAACRRAGVTVGSTVLITGAGPIGLLCARVARLFGATTVVVSDVNPERLDAALAAGADSVVNVLTERLADVDTRFDVHLECSGVAAAAHDGMSLLGNRGACVLVGMGLGPAISLPVAALQVREITVTGAFRYANTYPAAIALAPLLDLDSLVSHTYDLAQTAMAMRAPRDEPSCIKPMIRIAQD